MASGNSEITGINVDTRGGNSKIDGCCCSVDVCWVVVMLSSANSGSAEAIHAKGLLHWLHVNSSKAYSSPMYSSSSESSQSLSRSIKASITFNLVAVFLFCIRIFKINKNYYTVFLLHSFIQRTYGSGWLT